MGQIKVSQYIEEIKEEFESGQFTQVIVHCRQILKQYPRYIDAYRLIGLALVAQNALPEAENIFQRVLSIDISDFVAHKNLAEIMAETGRIEQAIWHIEHAFEIDPNQTEVADKREQYYRRAGIPAPAVNGMPLASVARLYIKSGIYDQAIEELNRMLVHNQDRLDWKAILAVAYWRDGRNPEALQLGETVLEILPNNYQARMVLGDIWWQNGREDIASNHLDILQQILLLDQDHQEIYPTAGQVLAQTERIPRQYTVTRFSEGEDGEEWSAIDWKQTQENVASGQPADSGRLNGGAVLEGGPEQPAADSDINYEEDELFAEDPVLEEGILDDLFESLDDDPSLTTSDMLNADAEWETKRSGTGMLDSFAADIEDLTESDLRESSEVGETDGSFNWLGSDDTDNELFQVGDDPDYLTESELSELPNIDSLFTSDLANAEQPEDPDQVDTIQEADGLTAFERAMEEGLGESGFLEEGVIEEPIVEESAENNVVEVEEVIEDPAAGLEFLDEDPFSSLEQETNKSIGDLDDDLDLFGTGTLETDEAEEATGFTNWLEDMDETADSENTDGLISDSDSYDPTSDAMAGGLFEFLSDDDNQLNPLPPARDTADYAENHEQSEAEPKADEPAIPASESDDELALFDEFDVDDLFSDDLLADELDGIVEQPAAVEAVAEMAAEPDEFAEKAEPMDEAQVEAKAEARGTDSLFDTSWLDSEPTEEIDLLAEPAADQFELKSYTDGYSGAFDDDLESEFQIPDDFDSMFDTGKESSSSIEKPADDESVSDLADAGLNDDLFEDELAFLDEIADDEPLAELQAADLEPTEQITEEDLADLFGEIGAEDEAPEAVATQSAELKADDDFPFLEDLSGFKQSADLPETEFSWDTEETIDGLIADEGDLSFLDAISDLPATSGILGGLDQSTPEEESASSAETGFDELFAGELFDEEPEPAAEPNFAEMDGADDVFEAVEAELAIDDEIEAEGGAEEKIEPEATSSIDWLIPEDESAADEPSAEKGGDDLSWLSLLEDASPLSGDGEVEDEDEVALMWTSDLSAAANPILSPSFGEPSQPDDQDGTAEPAEDASPEWLIEFPEYNDGANMQTGRLEDEPFHDTGRFTKGPLPEIGQPHDLEPAIEEEKKDLFEEQEFDPDMFRESTAIKLPDWLSDSTESASLGFEPDPALDVDLDSAADQSEADQPQAAALLNQPEPASADALSFLEDDQDMERDKDGNPIPPESQDLEDTLNWLEEIATIDVLGEDITPPAADLALPDAQSASDEEPLSDIFSAGSSLHAFADLEDIGETAEIDEAADGDVSEETLTWLDDLFTAPDEPLTELPPSAPITPVAPAEEIENSLEDVFLESEEAELDGDDSFLDALLTDDDVVAEAPAEIPDLQEAIAEPIESLTDDIFGGSDLIEAEAKIEADVPAFAPELNSDFEDFHVSQDEISQAVEFGDAVEGMDDIPDDPDALMAWLNLDLGDSAEADPNTDVEVEDSIDGIDFAESADMSDIIEDELPEIEIPQIEEETVELASKPAKSMFGDADDIHISAEEISQAAEFGDAVEGMDDIPDDPDALMAWLNLDLGDDVEDKEPSTFPTKTEEISDTFELIEDEPVATVEVAPEPEIEADIAAHDLVEPASQPAKSMFGDADDIHISAEEISQAAEFGDVVEGMDDIPDDPDALMAWLNLDLGDSDAAEAEAPAVVQPVDEVVEVAPEIEETLAAADPIEPASQPAKSMFGDADDIHISAEEISQAAEFGDVVEGMDDIPDDPDALMAWLNLDLGDDEGDGEIDLTEPADTDQQDELIIADLDSADSEFSLEPVTGADELDDALDELSGDQDSADDDLIFGDLGTGRLSGSEWLDKMTFDSDPALLGEVSTVLPEAVPDAGVDAQIDNILESIPADVEADAGDLDLDGIEDLGELPEDPDEFMKILETNGAEDPLSAELDLEAEASDLDLGIASDDVVVDAGLPDFLQVDTESADESLGWLNEGSPSGVFNWLEAEENALGAVETTDEEPKSIFDSDYTEPVADEDSLLQELTTMVAEKRDIPQVIERIRTQLAVRSDPSLQKLLGDAYMEAGQLQDALNAYRQAQRLI